MSPKTSTKRRDLVQLMRPEKFHEDSDSDSDEQLDEMVDDLADALGIELED